MEETKRARRGENKKMSGGEVDEDDDGCRPEGFCC